MMPKIHALKTDPKSFDAVFNNVKTFEIRFDDRNFQVGEVLLLQETKYSGEEMKKGNGLVYTGRAAFVKIIHKLKGEYGLTDGWCILSIEKHHKANQAIEDL